MADAVHGNAQLGATKMDIITALVQKELKFKAKLAPFFTDVSRFAVKGAKTISFPKLGSFVVGTRPSGTAGNATVINSSTDTLPLDVPAYLAYIIDQNDSIQSTIEFESEAAKRAGSAHARYFELSLINKLIDMAGLDLNHAGDIDLDSILAMRQWLIGNESMTENMVLIVAEDQETAMLKIPEFIRADIYGSSNVPAGVIGKVFGVQVVVHTGFPAGQAVMADKEALAYGFQLAPNTSEQPANEYGSQAKRVAVDQLYGVQAMQLDAECKNPPAAGKSALIAKLK